MNNFSELVTSSVLARALALIILALVVIAAIVVGAVELLTGQAINPIIWTIAGTGLGTALSIVNINYGVVLQPSPPPAKPPIPPTEVSA